MPRPGMKQAPAVIALTILLLPACAPAGGAGENGRDGGSLVHATLESLAFAPAVIEASVGDTVVWRNEDIVPHTVDAADNSWTSGEIRPEQVFRHVMTEAGAIELKCLYHPVMKAKVVVAH